MSQEFRLADIGEGLEEAEIIEWKVAVGDRVVRDQPLVEVMTDKSNAELPAPCDGIVLSVGGAVGDIVEVGGLLAVIDDNAPAMNSPAARASIAPTESAASNTSRISTFQSAAQRSVGVPVDDASPAPGRPKASPSTRSEAARRGIDLAMVIGTGPGGRILLSDLDRAQDDGVHPITAQTVPPAPLTAAETLPEHNDVPVSTLAPIPAQSPDLSVDQAEPRVPSEAEPRQSGSETSVLPVEPPANVVPLRGIRRVIAQNMARSWSDIPHIHAFAHIDAEPMLELRAQLKASGRAEYESLTPLSFFVAAVTAAMSKHPEANASLDLDRGEITNHLNVNVGIAVAAPSGLVVPVIQCADLQAFPEIALAVRNRVDQARSGDLAAADFRDGTVTITNFGSLGGEQALPLIRPPESAIFGFGSIAARPFVIDGEVVARKTLNLVIGADHRLLDGDITTAMLNHIAELLTNPINLVLND